MSQPGATLTIDDIGFCSWALIAYSAINNGSSDEGAGASGIMAGSKDVVKTILSGDIDSLFIFPLDCPPGLYLWHGGIEEDGAPIGTTERLHPDCMQHWIDLNDE